jgi:hypothetical protein
MIKEDEMGSSHSAHGANAKSYKILVRKSQGKRSLGRQMHRKGYCPITVFVNTAMNIQVP